MSYPQVQIIQILQLANRFRQRRFAYVEAGARKQGKALKKMTLEEMNALWEEGN